MALDKQKNVIFFISSLTGGGAERVVSTLSLHIRSEVEQFIVIYSSDVAIYPHNAELIRLEPQKTGIVKGWFQKIYFLYRYVRALRIIKQEKKIHVCVSFLRTPNLINILSRGPGKKIISVRSHTSKQAPNAFNHLMGFFIKLLYNRADLIVANSQGVKTDLVKNFHVKREKVMVINNPCDCTSVRELMNEDIENKFESLFRDPVVINAGRLTHLKGQSHLIRAFAEVRKKHSRAKLIILGEGELENNLKTLVGDLQLSDAIIFLGFQKNPFKFIKRSTLYVFPSLSEGFPNALVEAMACGIPVISSDCPSGPREILAPELDIEKTATRAEHAQYGILVPVCEGIQHRSLEPLTKEEKCLAETISNLLENRTLQEKYSLLSRKRAEDYDLEKILPLWENVLFN